VAALAPYTLEGAYGRLLDAASEELASAPFSHACQTVSRVTVAVER